MSMRVLTSPTAAPFFSCAMNIFSKPLMMMKFVVSEYHAEVMTLSLATIPAPPASPFASTKLPSTVILSLAVRFSSYIHVLFERIHSRSFFKLSWSVARAYFCFSRWVLSTELNIIVFSYMKLSRPVRMVEVLQVGLGTCA